MRSTNMTFFFNPKPKPTAQYSIQQPVVPSTLSPNNEAGANKSPNNEGDTNTTDSSLQANNTG